MGIKLPPVPQMAKLHALIDGFARPGYCARTRNRLCHPASELMGMGRPAGQWRGTESDRSAVPALTRSRHSASQPPQREVEPSRGYAAAFLSPDALLGSERHCEDASTKAESTTRDLVLAELSRGQFAHRKCLSRIPACFRRANSFSDSQPGVTSSDAASA